MSMVNSISAHSPKAYDANDYFTTQDFKRIQRKHPEALKDAIKFNDDKFINSTASPKTSLKDKIKDLSSKVSENTKGLLTKLADFAKGHKLIAGAIAAVIAIATGIGVYSAIKHGNKEKAQEV